MLHRRTRTARSRRDLRPRRQRWSPQLRADEEQRLVLDPRDPAAPQRALELEPRHLVAVVRRAEATAPALLDDVLEELHRDLEEGVPVVDRERLEVQEVRPRSPGEVPELPRL